MPIIPQWVRSRSLWRTLAVLVLLAVTAGGSFVVGVLVHKYRDQIRGRLSAVQSGGVLSTNLYNIAVQKVRLPEMGRDGGIAPLEDGVLLASRTGSMWFVDRARALHSISSAVPVNFDVFIADPQNAELIAAENFGVKDLLLQSLPDRVRLFASYNLWYPELDCYTLRVSMLETSAMHLRGEVDELAPVDEWRTVFETSPCYPLSLMPDGGSPHPTLGAGGRMASLSDNEILLTVGGFKSEGIEQGGPAYYWDHANSYGKTIRINVESGSASIFTVGHRNPQGLVVARDSTVWLTEHAARGGDELNQLVLGANYGYPAVSYGTAYDAMTWPTNPQQGRHEGYAKPMYAWIPSIGISQVVAITHDGFPDWKGDLIVASMAMEHLYRVRIEEGRAIFAEPIRINHRVRDIIETPAGALVLKTDDDFLIYLERVDVGSAAAASLPPVERGQLLSSACTSCHSFTAGAPDGIGPNLHGVVGRRVASRDGYAYTDALKRVSGDWTPEALRQFLANPAQFAPGNKMAMTSQLETQQIADLVTYLESLR